MANVDPFVIRWPQLWLNDKEIGPVIRYLDRFLHDLWIRSGGANDSVSDGDIKELFPWLPDQDPPFEVIELSGTAHTTRGNEIVICNNTALATITLNPSPDHKERAVIVRNNSGGVKVTAVKKINGKTTKTIVRRYTSIDHIFTTEADSWNTI